MPYSIDYFGKSMNKYGEELCGDHIETMPIEEGFLVVLSDGLGSGVKANILATLTSKIAITMLKEGASIEETIQTIVNTLPECQVRKLAYSTFTIIKLHYSGEVYMVEYDNPPAFYYRKNKLFNLIKRKREVNGKIIYESNFRLNVGDTLTIVSDGAVHAGVGMTLNLGWQWEHIAAYLEDLVGLCNSSEEVTSNLLGVCANLYNQHAGDDTTVLTLKITERRYIDLFTGPPKNKCDDAKLIEAIRAAKGKVVLCGGTTANIVSAAFQEPIHIDLVHYTKEVPPMGRMQGVDLVTEGLLTLNKTKVLLQDYMNQMAEGGVVHWGEDGASCLARLLIEDATHVHCWIGQAVNPAHQNPNLPQTFNLKNTIMNEIITLLEQMGKNVVSNYL